MKNFKLIVTDLDRTLLRTDKTISAYSTDVLLRCQRQGTRIAFATARPKRSVLEFIETIPVDALILNNGASAYAGEKLLHYSGIESKVKDALLLAMNRDFPDVTIAAEIDDVFYTNFEHRNSIRSDFTNLPDKCAEKIIVAISSSNDLEKISAYLPEDLYIEVSDERLGYIMNRDTSKWKAVRKTASYFGIPLTEVAVFGDDFNDLEMIRKSGTGVAVANAVDDVKAAADCICDTNDNDGVAKWLEENVLCV